MGRLQHPTHVLAIPWWWLMVEGFEAVFNFPIPPHNATVKEL